MMCGRRRSSCGVDDVFDVKPKKGRSRWSVRRFLLLFPTSRLQQISHNRFWLPSVVIGNRLASILSSHLGSLAWYDLKVGAWARPNETERERFSPSHGMFSLRERAPERWNGNQGGAFFYNSFYSFATIRSNLNLGLSCVSSPAVASQKLTIKALLHSGIPPCTTFLLLYLSTLPAQHHSLRKSRNLFDHTHV